MSFLTRWRASEKNLMGPDFDKAPWEEIDLSGSIMRFKNPPLTAMIPFVPTIKKIDIYDNNAFDKPVHDYEKSYGKRLAGNGWNFFSGLTKNSGVGGLLFDVIVQKSLSVQLDSDSLLNDKNLISWILQREKRSWNKINDEMLIDEKKEDWPRIKEQYFVRFARENSDVKAICFNGNQWFAYSSCSPGKPTKYKYRLAISHEHTIMLIFDSTCYVGDYYSPEHNLSEAVETAISSFMKNIHISLSPEAEQQRKAANLDT